MNKEMHIYIEDDFKKLFHAAYVLWGKKMSQVVIELIGHWLQTNEASPKSEGNR